MASHICTQQQVSRLAPVTDQGQGLESEAAGRTRVCTFLDPQAAGAWACAVPSPAGREKGHQHGVAQEPPPQPFAGEKWRTRDPATEARWVLSAPRTETGRDLILNVSVLDFQRPSFNKRDRGQSAEVLHRI